MRSRRSTNCATSEREISTPRTLAVVRNCIRYRSLTQIPTSCASSPSLPFSLAIKVISDLLPGSKLVEQNRPPVQCRRSRQHKRIMGNPVMCAMSLATTGVAKIRRQTNSGMDREAKRVREFCDRASEPRAILILASKLVDVPLSGCRLKWSMQHRH
jgi:hypothetical protein